MVRRFFIWLLAHRLVGVVCVLGLTGLLGTFAARVRPDYSVEQFFPVWDAHRQVFDRFKRAFPHEDSQALVVLEAGDIYTRAGLERIGRLEADLKAIEVPGDDGAMVAAVRDIDGPLSTLDILARDGDVVIEKIFRRPDLAPDELVRQREIATTDRLFAWNLAKPDGSAVTIRLILIPSTVDDDLGRKAFLAAARAVLAKHDHPGQRLVLSGLPAIRARFTELIETDVNTLLPLAILVVLVLLFATYRSFGCVLAGLVTMIASVVWTYGAMGLLGYPITLLSAMLPVIVVIISMSDTVHIVNDFLARRRRGEPREVALAEAMTESAGPCLATEVVLACGFLSLIAVNIVAIVQLGVSSAAAMLLTWLANVTVLPLCLSLVRTDGRARGTPEADFTGATAPAPVRAFGRVVSVIETAVTRRRALVLGVAGLIVVLSAASASQIERISFVFDDLRPGSPLSDELRFAEETHGGLVPVAIYVEALDEDVENAILEPEVVRLLERAADLLRGFDEVRAANSVADHLRKSHRAFADGDDDDGLPQTRAGAAQEVLLVDDGDILRDHLAYDRRSAAALGWAVDVGSKRVATMFEAIDQWVATEQARLDALPDGPRVRISATGQLRIFNDVNDALIGGLARSFLGAVGVTLLVFCLVLRSVRLGVIGMIPNVSPMVLVFAFMATTGIALRVSIVVIFSIILVIADDDTMQYLARLRSHWARERRRARAEGRRDVDLHHEAAMACLRETGLPMFVTSTAVALGFGLLLLSQFQGIADIGLIIGFTLFAAVFADLFISPILISFWKPRLGPGLDEPDEPDEPDEVAS